VKLTALAGQRTFQICYQPAAKAIGTQTPEKRHRTNQLTPSFAAILEPRSGRKIVRQQRLVKLLQSSFLTYQRTQNADRTGVYRTPLPDSLPG